MKKYAIWMICCILLASSSFAYHQHEYDPPPSVFIPDNFLRIQSIPEMNVDFAIAWTDSLTMLFLQPYDAVILHVQIGFVDHDVFIFSDAGMQRLLIWMLTPPDAQGHRLPEKFAVYYGEDCDSGTL